MNVQLDAIRNACLKRFVLVLARLMEVGVQQTASDQPLHLFHRCASAGRRSSRPISESCSSQIASRPSSAFLLTASTWLLLLPPYDGQSKYGNGEKYERDWYEGYFLSVTAEILRTLKPTGSFVLNYRSRRRGDERGTLQYELIFWLRDQGFLFCEDFVWGKPSPPPGRFKRYLKEAVEYCFQFR